MKQDLNEKLDSFVSVVTIISDSTGDLEHHVTEIYKHLDKHFTDYEIILLDQSLDGIFQQHIDNLLSVIPSVRYMQLASPVPNDIALAAGIENAIGDFVVLMTLNEDPADIIIDLVNKCFSGYDIVIGVSDQNRTLGYKVVRPFVKQILKSIDYDIPNNATSLRCLSRRTVNSITQTGRFHHQFYVRINKTGYPYVSYMYKLKNKDGNTRTLRKGIKQAVNLLVFNSTKPLRWMSVLGLFGSFMAFAFAFYSLVIRFFKDNIIEGWTTAVLFSSMLFMILFIILAFFGEYMSRLLDDRSEQRDYSIASEKNSSVMINQSRYNVTEEFAENTLSNPSSNKSI